MSRLTQQKLRRIILEEYRLAKLEEARIADQARQAILQKIQSIPYVGSVGSWLGEKLLDLIDGVLDAHYTTDAGNEIGLNLIYDKTEEYLSKYLPKFVIRDYFFPIIEEYVDPYITFKSREGNLAQVEGGFETFVQDLQRRFAENKVSFKNAGGGLTLDITHLFYCRNFDDYAAVEAEVNNSGLPGDVIQKVKEKFEDNYLRDEPEGMPEDEYDNSPYLVIVTNDPSSGTPVYPVFGFSKFQAKQLVQSIVSKHSAGITSKVKDFKQQYFEPAPTLAESLKIKSTDRYVERILLSSKRK